MSNEKNKEEAAEEGRAPDELDALLERTPVIPHYGSRAQQHRKTQSLFYFDNSALFSFDWSLL